MSSIENAIVIKDLYKSFRLPHESHNGIKQLIISAFNGKRVKGYEEQKVLQDISFEIKKGDFYGIVGRNGSGKSTLLKLISGIYTPDKGSVTTVGSLTPFIELGVGFNPELTGRENIYLNGALLGFSRDEMGRMYEDIVRFAELERFMDQKLKNYSSGMQVRLAFSIAIRSKSDILVLDEVLAVGDEAFQKKCNQFFADIKKDKTKTVILVTHGMDAVRRYCNKAILIEKGHIIAQGTPDDVADEYSKQFIQNNDPTAIKEKNRYGTGEVTYANVKHSYKDNDFVLDFDLVNKTKTNYTTVTMGFDFCVNGEMITGNDTRYLEGFKSGISVGANSKKHFTIKFPNNFGNQHFTLNANITTEIGINVTDHVRGILNFDSKNTQYSDAWKVLSFPEVIVGNEK